MIPSRISTRRGLASGLLGVAAISLLPMGALAAPPTSDGGVTLEPLGTFDGGGLAHAEIVAYDATSERIFISNDEEVAVDIVSIADPTNPTLVTSFDVSAYGDGVNGVAVHRGIVAAAVERDPAFDAATGVATPTNGRVVLFNRNGVYMNTLEVGVLPDMVAFSPDGSKIVVAGEAEPICAEDVGGGQDSDVSLAVDPPGTVAIIDMSGGAYEATVELLDFSGFDTATLQAAGVRIFWPGSSAAEDLEPEYVTVAADGRTAYVTLQEANAVAVVDLTTPAITAVVPLGLKSWADQQVDPSDRDAGHSLGSWNVSGMYMPDAIASFTVGGATYLATANEGDSRDYDCYSEEERLADLDYTGTSLGEDLVAQAQDDALLGRVKTTTAMPTTDPISGLIAYGGRSFSIWNSSGSLVWDSGSEFVEIVARDFPDYVNTNADDEAATARAMVESMADGADARSDDKGTEPEAVAVGRIGDRQYAFIGLERQGGIMVYDVTDPSAPAFEDYVNLALSELASGGDFTGPGTTDVSPEGVVFVSASSSPNGEPLVIVANELSGTTTVYAVRGTEIDAALATVATLPATGGSMDALVLALIAIASGGTLLVTRRRA